MSFKIVIIGAGSLGFTRRLMSDILSVEKLQDVEITFTDINSHNLDMVTKLCQRDIDANDLNIKIQATTNRKEAFKGAKYIFNLTRIGGLEAFETDISIPLKYGIDQCVGDTLCAGGIMYAQRGIIEILNFCKDIRDVADSNCLLMNYGNPNAMLTWAANKYGGIKTVGLCHGVYHGHKMIANAFNLDINEVDIVCAGINHQTWYIKITNKGEDLTKKLLSAFEKDPEILKTEKVRIDMLRRFGYFSTESNGHLSEYLPWYRKRKSEISKWIDISCENWIHGETGGYLRVCRESRNWFETDFPNWMKDKPYKFLPNNRSNEHASYIIESLECGNTYRGHFNVTNNGCITNLPKDCIVEVPGYIDANGINIPRVGDLPLGCAAVCNNSISVQRLAVEAAVHGDDLLLRQAMMLDPLVGAVCNPLEIWQLVDEMLVAQKQWLPQYKNAIKKAEKRLSNDNLIVTNSKYSGIRIKEKDINEMKKDRKKASKLAQAAHKETNNSLIFQES
jgi:alpha-galactosidase/6-phospho-beta-glucosidase family protein